MINRFFDELLPLVSDEHDDHVAVAVLPRVLQPGRQVVEGVPGNNIIILQVVQPSSQVVRWLKVPGGSNGQMV